MFGTCNRPIRRAVDDVVRKEFGGKIGPLRRRVLRRLVEAEWHHRPFIPPVTAFELFVSEECNLRCDYCFIRNKRPQHMDPAIMRAAVDLLIRLSEDAGSLTVVLFGGEPLLNWPCVEETAAYTAAMAKKHNKEFLVNLTTNGTLLTPERIEFIRRAGLHVMLSVDGLPETHDRHRHFPDGSPSYAAVVRYLPLLLEYFPDLPLRITVHPDSAGQLYEGVLSLAEQGGHYFVICVAQGTKWTFEQGQELLRQFRTLIPVALEGGPHGTPLNIHLIACDPFAGWGCRAGRGFLTVGANGEVGPCSTLMGIDDLRRAFILGNVRGGALDLWRWRAFLGLNRHRLNACPACDFGRWCWGGCIPSNYWVTGHMLRPAPCECFSARIMFAARDVFRRLARAQVSVMSRQQEGQSSASPVPPS